MQRPSNADQSRDGMILLVVLALLTLFAILGITFVLYSESVALAARYGSTGRIPTTPDMDPYDCFSLFLGQAIYDVNDGPNYQQGLVSALRGHSLARNMYGWNSAVAPAGNTVPFNGIGRLHFKYSSTGANGDPVTAPINGLDDWQLINYQSFRTLDGNLIRDPEYFGIRNSVAPAGHTYMGGLNPTYTYPDQNNLFLGAIRASDGVVIARSYHRDYSPASAPSIRSTLARSCPTQTGALASSSVAGLKYIVLRPRPVDNPDPVTGATGDPSGLSVSRGCRRRRCERTSSVARATSIRVRRLA